MDSSRGELVLINFYIINDFQDVCLQTVWGVQLCPHLVILSH